MRFVKKVNNIEVYELSEAEQAHYGTVYYCVKAGDLNIIEWMVTSIYFSGVTIQQVDEFLESDMKGFKRN